MRHSIGESKGGTVNSAAGSEVRVQMLADGEFRRLHEQFVHAHGITKGEITTLSSSGVFYSGPLSGTSRTR